MKQSYFSHGKLLLTGEYLVLNGAMALAIPTNKGQELTVDLLPGSGNLHWTAKDVDGNIWLNFSFILQEDHLIPVAMGTLGTSPEVTRLKRVLENALKLNPLFINDQTDYEVSTHLQFPGDWGLGSSSTLVANIAKWAGVDAMSLFFGSWEGSGYDVAVAIQGNPIVYHLENKKPVWQSVNYTPPFAHSLFFVHLGYKQSSEGEIATYKNGPAPGDETILRISEITEKMVKCETAEEFETLITEHESIIAAILNTTPVKSRLFHDYPHAIKSLGAWGGDFILAVGKEAPAYFSERGYKIVLGWEEMINN